MSHVLKVKYYKNLDYVIREAQEMLPIGLTMRNKSHFSEKINQNRISNQTFNRKINLFHRTNLIS